MPELVRLHRVTEKTLYRWNRNYGGMQIAAAKRLKALGEEGRQLKRFWLTKH